VLVRENLRVLRALVGVFGEEIPRAEDELVQAGRWLGRGCASVAAAGSVDDDVYSQTGCVFILVDRVQPSA